MEGLLNIYAEPLIFNVVQFSDLAVRQFAKVFSTALVIARNDHVTYGRAISIHRCNVG